MKGTSSMPPECSCCRSRPSYERRKAVEECAMRRVGAARRLESAVMREIGMGDSAVQAAFGPAYAGGGCGDPMTAKTTRRGARKSAMRRSPKSPGRVKCPGPLVRAADIAAYIIRKHCLGDDLFNDLFVALVQCMWRQDGVLEGHGIKHYPDRG